MHVKRDIVMLTKTCMFLIMLFLDHIHLFSILTSLYNVTKFNLIHIDPFRNDTNVIPLIGSHSFTPILDHGSYRVSTNSSTDIGILFPDAPTDCSSSTASEVLFKNVAPPFSPA